MYQIARKQKQQIINNIIFTIIFIEREQDKQQNPCLTWTKT